MLIIYGTKVRRIPLGVVASACPRCGQHVVADAYQFQRSGHIYFVALDWKNAGRFTVCRLCLAAMPLHPDLTVVENPGSSLRVPTAELIAASNPVLDVATPVDLEPIIPPLPSTVTRWQWALLRGLLELHQEAFSTIWRDLSVFAGVLILAGMFAAFMLDAIYQIPALSVTKAIVAVLPAIVIALWRWSVHEGHLSMRSRAYAALQHYFVHTSTGPRDLIQASLTLGRPYRRMRPFLRWFALHPDAMDSLPAARKFDAKSSSGSIKRPLAQRRPPGTPL